MSQEMYKLVKLTILVLFLPFALNTFVYHGFGTNYTEGVFSQETFQAQYENNIFQYRPLGRVLFLKTYDGLKNIPRVQPIAELLMPPAIREVQDHVANPVFYLTYYAFNTAFFCLLSAVLYWFLLRVLPEPVAAVKLLVFQLLVAVSQYVLVPYDLLSYFLIACAMVCILRGNSLGHAAGAALFLIIATLTRESAALILSFFGAVYGRWSLRFLGWSRAVVIRLAVLVTAFLSVYVGLRVFYGASDGLVFCQIRALQNFNARSVVGMLFLPGMLLALCPINRSSARAWLFVMLSSPYIIGMWVVANPWEIRLWIPVFLGVLLLNASDSTVLIEEKR